MRNKTFYLITLCGIVVIICSIAQIFIAIEQQNQMEELERELLECKATCAQEARCELIKAWAARGSAMMETIYEEECQE